MSAPSSTPFVSKRHVAALLGCEWRRLVQLAENVGYEYTSFDTPAGKKWRHIDNPSRHLKLIQRRISRRLLQTRVLGEHMYGAAPGGSVLKHVSVHQGQRHVVTLDLRNCFPRTTHQRVHGVFTQALRCSRPIARVLTKLTTFHRRLPQGAPTSGLLAHLSLCPLYQQLLAVCCRYELRLSFYMDDIAMSGAQVRRAIPEAIRLIGEFGHSVRCAKTRVMGSTKERRITNLVLVREGVQVPSEYIATVEHELLAALAKNTVTTKEVQRLEGMLHHIERVNAAQAVELRKLAAQLREPTWSGTRKPLVRRSCAGKAKCRALSRSSA